MNPRNSAIVGDRFHFILAKPVARMVALAGVQMKFEAVFEVTGTITAARETGALTNDGRKEVEFTVRAADGAEYTLTKGNVTASERLASE